jgi:corrinoid protein of di/trimethylamine methyltransferase
MLENPILKKIEEGVVAGDMDCVLSMVKQALASGIEPYKIISEGLSHGMKIVGEKYEASEYYLPDVIVAAQAMYAGVDLVKPHIKVDPSKVAGKIVIGTIEGDVHDIGKNLVKLMYIGAGWQVFDLGQDVPLQSFIDKAKESQADLIAVSALMTTSMLRMKNLADMITKQGISSEVGLIIGGAPVSEEYANSIGADGFAPDAAKAVPLGEKVVLSKRH